jgi:hypothetical protein
LFVRLIKPEILPINFGNYIQKYQKKTVS